MIQGYADFLIGLGISIFCIGGVVICIAGGMWILVGVCVAVFGSLLMWLTGSFLRSFGELVSNSAETVELLKRIADQREEATDNLVSEVEQEKQPVWQCAKCGTINPGWSRTCKTCMRK